MLLDGSNHDLEGDCESATHQLYSPEKPDTEEVDDHVELSGECLVKNEEKNIITFLVKELKDAESKLILGDSISSGNQLQHDQSNKATAARATTASSKSAKNMKSFSGEGAEANHGGFQTPTKILDSICLKCPPAPRKPKAKPPGKRKREGRNLQVEFVLRLLSTEVPKRYKPSMS